MWLPAIGDMIKVKESVNSGYWEILTERVRTSLMFDTYAGYGSGDTMIFKYTNNPTNIGNFATHNHGSYGTHGLEVTAQRSGLFAIQHMVLSANAGGSTTGTSINSNQLTTAITTITAANILHLTYQNNSIYECSLTTVRRLNKGDVIRPHGDSAVPHTASRETFLVEYIGQG
jgi:hypothetical protein